MYSYDACSNAAAGTGPVANSLLYAGAYLNNESGCYYDPATAQFLTRDPLVAASEPGYNYASGFRRRSG